MLQLTGMHACACAFPPGHGRPLPCRASGAEAEARGLGRGTSEAQRRPGAIPQGVQGGARLARDDAEHERLGRADVQVVQAHGAEQAVRAREARVGLPARVHGSDRRCVCVGPCMSPMRMHGQASRMQACSRQAMMTSRWSSAAAGLRAHQRMLAHGLHAHQPGPDHLREAWLARAAADIRHAQPGRHVSVCCSASEPRRFAA